jgi:hypothetical protein
MAIKEDWKEVLDTLKNEDKWHIKELLDGQIDPYGSTTIHGRVTKVIVRSHSDPSKKVDFTLSQVFFFFFFFFSICLELVMEDENLSHVDRRIQAYN